MPSSLAEDVVFIVFFYSVYTIINILVPYFYRILGVEENDYILLLLIWFVIAIILAIILKNLQNDRYKDELNDVEDIIGNGIDGFNVG